MEHLEGETLADRIAKGPLPLDQALAVATEIADALSGCRPVLEAGGEFTSNMMDCMIALLRARERRL